jgi:hypothetical protein
MGISFGTPDKNKKNLDPLREVFAVERVQTIFGNPLRGTTPADKPTKLPRRGKRK